jgi:hypothetical protein
MHSLRNKIRSKNISSGSVVRRDLIPALKGYLDFPNFSVKIQNSSFSCSTELQPNADLHLLHGHQSAPSFDLCFQFVT